MKHAIPMLESALIVRLQLDASDQVDTLGALRAVFEQVPAASEVAPGTWAAIPDTVRGDQGRGLFRRMRARAVRVHRATRCTALLARGYTQLGAGIGSDGVEWAWGRAPSARDG